MIFKFNLYNKSNYLTKKIMENKNTFAKISAIIALIAILWSVVWTWALVLFENLKNDWNTSNTQNLPDEQLKDILKLYTWAVNWTWWENENNSLSGKTN